MTARILAGVVRWVFARGGLCGIQIGEDKTIGHPKKNAAGKWSSALSLYHSGKMSVCTVLFVKFGGQKRLKISITTWQKHGSRISSRLEQLQGKIL